MRVTIKRACLTLTVILTGILYFQEFSLLTPRDSKLTLNVRTFDVKRSPNISSSTNKTSLLRNNTITVPQSLKRVKDLHYNIFLFSAIVGNTSEKTVFDRVVINAWTDRKYGNSSSFKCCLRFKSRRLVQKALITRINWAYMWSTKVQAKQYVCPNPRGRYGDTVVGVTIAYNRTKCPIAPIWYVKPSYAYRHENEIAICAKVAYGNLPAMELLSWFEIHRYMGVNKVLTYTENLNPAAQKVLDYYSSIGMVETVPFVVPKYRKDRQAVAKIGVKNFQAWNDEQIPVWDCLEKLRGYKYMAVVDFDEYIIPEKDENWTKFFDRLWRRRPWAAGFRLLVQLHITSWGSTNSSGHFIAQKFLNRTRPMVDRNKNVVKPDRLGLGGLSTHGFWPDYKRKFRRGQCPSSLGTIHHFRSCRKEWNGKKNRTNCMELQRFTDPIVANVMAKVESKALALKNKLFPTDVIA